MNYYLLLEFKEIIKSFIPNTITTPYQIHKQDHHNLTLNAVEGFNSGFLKIIN